MKRNPRVDWGTLDDVIYGCANQAGEDNRNVARMALLLAGLPVEVPASTINRLCGSGMDALGTLARAIRAGEAEIGIAGGVESMSRAPFVMPKAESAFSRANAVYDTTLGWRFVNPKMKARYGIDAMPETAENVAQDYNVSRADQDAFALRSQERALEAQESGALAEEIIPVTLAARKGDPVTVLADEHPRETSLEALAALKPIVKEGGTVTAGNASGVNELGVAISKFDVIELNEAFASQALAVLRELGVPDDAPHVNPNGGAIALGHPLGASGARLVTTAMYQLRRTGGKLALCTMCIGVGQGIALAIERA